jgi:molybdopterin synthase sulfur carrier subunit
MCQMRKNTSLMRTIEASWSASPYPRTLYAQGEVKETRIRVKFLSTMKQVAGQDGKAMVIDESASVADLLNVVATTYNKNVATLLFEEDKTSIRSDVLILVNDVEIGVLEGDETRLSEGDEVAIMPIAHGG